MSVKDHYENHLSNFYSWMTGDFGLKCNEFKSFLVKNSVYPNSTKVAIDLGAGHGIQSIPMAELGFEVTAVDFSQNLLKELEINSNGMSITLVNDDIRNVKRFDNKPELIVCCGDTLTHLDSSLEIRTLILHCIDLLGRGGKLILSFRDYSIELKGNNRIIPVKSDDSKILTCVLDYEEDFVMVTDLLYEKSNELWQPKMSSYKKVRISENHIAEILTENGMTITFHGQVSRLTTIIAIKEPE